MRLAPLLLLLAAACAGPQRLIVETEPPGATVTLTRISERRAQGGLYGFSGHASQGIIHEEPIDLGTSPLQYAFERTRTEQAISLPGVYGSVTLETREGIVRAERDGRFAERRVRFDGSPVHLRLELNAEISDEPPAPEEEVQEEEPFDPFTDS